MSNSTPSSTPNLILDLMLSFAEANYYVFPLLKRIQKGQNKLGTPVGWNHNNPNNQYSIPSSIDSQVVKEWFETYKDIIGYGINPRNKRALILDVDIGEGKTGNVSLSKLMKEHKLADPSLIIKSKSGGLHIYYEHPKDDILGLPFPEYEFIDIRTSNNFVVGPGSFITPEQPKGKYQIIRGLPKNKLTPLPKSLIQILPKRISIASNTSLVSEENILLLGKIPEVIKYGERDNTLIKLIGSWVRSGISRENIIILTETAISKCETFLNSSNPKYDPKNTLFDPTYCPRPDPLLIDDYISKIDNTFGKTAFTKPNAEPLQHLINNAIYIAKHEAVYEIQGRKLRTKGLISLYAPLKYYVETASGKMKEVSAFKEWLKSDKRKEAESFGYHPLADHILYDDTQECEVVNMYRPPRLTDKDNTIDYEAALLRDKINYYKEFEDFCSYLFGKKADFMIDWAAYQVQHADKKLVIAPVMVSEERGIGKNLFFDIVSSIIGKHNTAVFTTERVVDTYNDYILRTHMVLVNESYIDIKDRWTRKNRNHIVEGIKGLITDSSQDVNPKFVIPFTAKSYVNYIFASNNLAAVPIDTNDRRFVILILTAKQQTTAFYHSMWNVTRREYAAYAVREGLLKREIKLVKQGLTAHALDDDKLAVIKANKSYIEEKVEESIENHEFVFLADIIVFELFAWYILEKVEPGMSLENIKSVFKYYCRPIYIQDKKINRQCTVDYPSLNLNKGFISGGKSRKGLYTCRDYDKYDTRGRKFSMDHLKAQYYQNYGCVESKVSKIVNIGSV